MPIDARFMVTLAGIKGLNINDEVDEKSCGEKQLNVIDCINGQIIAQKNIKNYQVFAACAVIKNCDYIEKIREEN